MITHVFYMNVEAGYFYRMYPRFEPLVKQLNREMDHEPKSLFPELKKSITNPIEMGSNRNYFHGVFLDKKIEHNKYFIALLTVAELHINDPVLQESESRTLSSIIVLEVPKSIYNYQFEQKSKYVVSLDKVLVIA